MFESIKSVYLSDPKNLNLRFRKKVFYFFVSFAQNPIFKVSPFSMLLYETLIAVIKLFEIFIFYEYQLESFECIKSCRFLVLKK